MNQEALGFVSNQIQERRSYNQSNFENQRRQELDSLDINMKKHLEQEQMQKQMFRQQQSDYRNVLDTQSQLMDSNSNPNYNSLNQIKVNNRYGQSTLW